MPTSVFYSLSAVFSFLTLYRLVVLFHHVHLCLPLSVQCLSVHHNIPSYVSVLLYHLLSSAVSPMSHSTSHCTFRLLCLFCVTMSTAVFYIFSLSVSTSHCTFSVFGFTVSNSLFYSLSTVFVEKLNVSKSRALRDASDCISMRRKFRKISDITENICVGYSSTHERNQQIFFYTTL